MKTNWDYTDLAEAYVSRPQYSSAAIAAMLKTAGIDHNSIVCDVGAGVGHLTLHLVEQAGSVTAVEPNDEMRKIGSSITRNFDNVKWIEGSGENTHQSAKHFDLVTFGSSFNVCDRAQALIETSRILKPNGWFACMWNHRDLDDSLQSKIEQIILKHVPSYSYGTRREDQENIILLSGLFSSVIQLSSKIVHQQLIEDCIIAWKSHATLERQSKDKFVNIIEDIETLLQKFSAENNTDRIPVPYQTNIWMAKVKTK